VSLVARVARILGDLTVALVTQPFGAEGNVRRDTAAAQLNLVRAKADGVVAFANDHLLRLAPDLPLAKSFAVLGGIMARAASSLGGVLARDDIVPLRRFLAKSRDWKFGMGAGTEKHRCFVAVDEAYRSPWFTGPHEDVRHAIVVLATPPGGGLEAEVLHEVRIRSPLADIAWGSRAEPTDRDRVAVSIFAGL
jgi:cell division protein FtsZ